MSKNRIITKPVTFTEDEMLVLIIIMEMGKETMTVSHDVLVQAIEEKVFAGDLEATLFSMDMVGVAEHQLTVLEQIRKKLGDSIP